MGRTRIWFPEYQPVPVIYEPTIGALHNVAIFCRIMYRDLQAIGFTRSKARQSVQRGIIRCDWQRGGTRREAVRAKLSSVRRLNVALGEP